jgi:hypothetical protein
MREVVSHNKNRSARHFSALGSEQHGSNLGQSRASFSELSRRTVVALAFEFDGVLPHREIRAVVRQAEAAALETEEPLLVLPLLAEERILSSVGWHRRQKQILDRSVLCLSE